MRLPVYVLGYLVGSVDIELVVGLRVNVGTIREVLPKTVRTERRGSSNGGFRFRQLSLEWSSEIAANRTFEPGGWLKPEHAATLRSGGSLHSPPEVCTEILRYFPEGAV